MEKQEEKLNIYQKIQRIKYELSTRELKKTGENKFSNFKYYQLSDFMPSVIELCNKYALFTKITFEKDEAKLLIVDSQSLRDEEGLKVDYIEYATPSKELELKGANAIQTLGGVQTYLRRYLYMNAFDIVEADMFDSEDFEKKQKQKKEKGEVDKIIDAIKKAFKEAKEVDKKAMGEKLKNYGYGSFTDLSKNPDFEKISTIAKELKISV